MAEPNPEARGFVPAQSFEINLNSEADLSEIESTLAGIFGQEAAEQLIFVLRSFQGEDFINHCRDATEEFGRRLATKYGEEEPFFDLAPQAQFYDVRSYDSLPKYDFTGKYHSVAMVRTQKDKQPVSLLVDLTFFTINRWSEKPNATLILKVQGGDSEALRALSEQYGGKWEVEMHFDKDNGGYRFVNDK